MRHHFHTTLCIVLSLGSVKAAASSYKIADEIETVGGHSLGFSNAGVAAVADVAAVRLNPAMLALESTYSVHASYHWPARGKEFYQAGVVDSKTSPIAAGILLTRSENGTVDTASPLKQKLKTRMALGLARSLKYISLGISAQYIETRPSVETLPSTGTSLGLGIAGLISPNLRFGASLENMNDGRLLPYAPKTTRAGLAYLTQDGAVTLHLDYVQREAVNAEAWHANVDAKDIWLLEPNAETQPNQAENDELLTLSGSAKVYDLLRLLASFGQATSGERTFAAIGMALVNGPMTLGYSAARPNLEFPESHQSFSFSLQMSM